MDSKYVEPPRQTGRRPEETAQKTRARIVEVALRLFAARGYAVVTVRDVAQAADVTHGLLRHHFGSKEGLWDAVLDAADARFRDAAEDLEQTDLEGDPITAIAELMRRVVQVSLAHPEIPQLLIQEAAAPSERLTRIIDRAAPLRRASDRALTALHAHRLLTQYDPPAFFMLVLGAVTLPFALPGLTQEIWGITRLDPQAAHAHIERTLQLLLGSVQLDPSPPPSGQQ